MSICTTLNIYIRTPDVYTFVYVGVYRLLKVKRPPGIMWTFRVSQ